MTQLLSRRELAAALKVSSDWIGRRSRDKHDPMPMIKRGHFIRYDPAEVERWLRGKTNGNART